MAHNPTLHCNIATSTIRTMSHESAAFFENILVTLNGTSTGIDLLGTSCRRRSQRTNQYTISCFHQDHMIEIGSGGSFQIIMIMGFIILTLFGAIAFMSYKTRREKRNVEILMEKLEISNKLNSQYEQQINELTNPEFKSTKLT